MAIVTAMAVLFLVLLLLETLGYLTNPYLGLLVFVAVPAIFVAGLILIPLGMWRTSRRMKRTPEAPPPEWPVVDLRNPRHRGAAVAILALTIVNLVLVSMAAYGSVHYMESNAFCGQVCHTTMEPQAVAHRDFPHAAVACTRCHIGSGTEAFLEAKLAGTRQLVHVITGNVPKPVPPPADLIQPADTTCGSCHSPIMQGGDTLRVLRSFADDEANTESVTTLRMRVGTPETSGIHRHLALDIEYAAADAARSAIPFVRARYPDGTAREFAAEGAARPAGAMRRMTCTDCHNRPAHTFHPTPGRAVDAALAEGRLPRDLPFLRREAVAAVSAEHRDRAEGLEEIERRLRAFYAARPDADPGLVSRAVTGAQQVWTHHVFPAMNVSWGTYPNHTGHTESPGCFRCHDERAAPDGRTIGQDCELCHVIE
jgi:hypothetical protein